MVYPNVDDNAKMCKAQRYYLPNGIIKNYKVTIIGKNFYDQLNDSDTKRYKERKKLTTEQGEDYITEY